MTSVSAGAFHFRADSGDLAIGSGDEDIARGDHAQFAQFLAAARTVGSGEGEEAGVAD